MAFFSGYFLVLYFTVDPIHMSLALLATVIFSIATILVSVNQFKARRLLLAIPLVLVSFTVGYSIQTSIFLDTPDSRISPELTRDIGDEGKDHTAVIYLTHGEPETYDPIGWINQFREFDEQDISFVPWLIRPYFAYQLRDGYLRIGRSDHVFIHKQMMSSLEREYRLQGDNSTKFYISFLDVSPSPRAAAIQALNDGASRIIVAEVFLTISNHTAEEESLIRELRIEEKFGVPVQFTSPLYDSESLKRMFLERARVNSEGIDPAKVGILLVGHGQPDEWDTEWPTETAQELSFRNSILELLAANGYKKDNLSLAWMSFKEPRPVSKVEKLVSNGVERILYFSAAISADAMISQHDLPELIAEADVPLSVDIRNMGAWNDDSLVIQAIKNKIDAQLNLDR
jgi:protoheme ferro-lyase